MKRVPPVRTRVTVKVTSRQLPRNDATVPSEARLIGPGKYSFHRTSDAHRIGPPRGSKRPLLG